ncbi:hypothetical protein [Phycobium rhodophyticola]
MFMQMKQLEERLGATLCQRGRSRLWLTDKGKIVLDSCHALLRSMDDFRAVVSARRDQSQNAYTSAF